MAILTLLGSWGAIAAETLKPGPGDDTTSAVCAACRTTDYIVMNSVFLTAGGLEGRGDQDAFGLRCAD